MLFAILFFSNKYMSKKINLLKFQDLSTHSKQPVRKETLVSKYLFIAVMHREHMIQEAQSHAHYVFG